MARQRIVVIGAGIGGLVAALLLAAQGHAVTLVEKEAEPGGKMRRVTVGGSFIDAGPTVMTMRWVFDRIFSDIGAGLDDHLRLERAAILARHAWSDSERLDLFADRRASADAIGAFAGPKEAGNYLAFCAQSRAVHDALKDSFMARERPGPLGLVRRAGLGPLLQANPFGTLWGALGRRFGDPRLRQLFARYATYCGSSPFAAPAILMLVAHVEQEGVFLVEGGMHRLAQVLAGLAQARGATLRYGQAVGEILIADGRVGGVRLADGEEIPASIVISNADLNALASGRLGGAVARHAAPVPARARSLSAVTFALRAETSGFPLQRHNVVFGRDYRAEFDAIFKRGRLPDDPTIYVCAQDRDGGGAMAGGGPERLLILVNAPPSGDGAPLPQAEIERCRDRVFTKLARCGLTIAPLAELTTQPADWERLYPGTGGALYGRATHGALASFARPGSRSRLKGLYWAGGSVHPGPGVPMAALSGLLAAQAVAADLAST